MLALSTSGLTKSYGGRVVVDHVDLELQPGTVTGFVGPNGAGKTTTLRMLLGLVAPSAGEGSVLGESLSHPERYLPQVGALIEAPAFYPKLSGEANLRVLARLAGVPLSRVAVVLGQVRLDGRERDKYRAYSLGMKQRLGLAAALLTDPQLLILDEPTNGMDPAGIREMRGLLRELADAGKTVLVSSHLLAEIESVCDNVVLIAEGKLRFQGPLGQLTANAANDELHLRPERAEDMGKLVGLLNGAELPPRVKDGEAIVSAGEDMAAELNYLAHRAGIRLKGLSVSRSSLEDAYFALTGHAQEEL